MKRRLLLLSMLLIGIIYFAQSAAINSSRSNIKRPNATYSPREGLTLEVKEADLTPAERKELAGGYFVAYENIVLTEAECKALKAPQATTIKAGKYPISRKGDLYIVHIPPAKK